MENNQENIQEPEKRKSGAGRPKRGAEKVYFRCEQCDWQHTARFHYDAHLKSVKHQKAIGAIPKIKMYTCNKCDYTSKYWGNWDRHQKKHQKDLDIESKLQ